ncbi:MAG: Fe-S cluster assembly sulfur transfer protein SufU [Chthoniobacterales bacterium]|jgi:nitrogen fixation protein NifU and related proteins
MSDDLAELYQDVILDHSRRPRNFGELPNPSVLIHGDNPSCGDEIHLGVRFGEEGALQEIKFSGHGCAISQASASMMTLKLKGKTRDEAEQLVRGFEQLIMAGAAPESVKLGDARLLGGVRKFPQRVKCAMLAWRAAEQALRQTHGDSTISTETELNAS